MDRPDGRHGRQRTCRRRQRAVPHPAGRRQNVDAAPARRQAAPESLLDGKSCRLRRAQTVRSGAPLPPQTLGPSPAPEPRAAVLQAVAGEEELSLQLVRQTRALSAPLHLLLRRRRRQCHFHHHRRWREPQSRDADGSRAAFPSCRRLVAVVTVQYGPQPQTTSRRHRLRWLATYASSERSAANGNTPASS